MTLFDVIRTSGTSNGQVLAIADCQYVEFGNLHSVSVLADCFGIRPGEETLLECRAVDIE
ncbi:hypothetical protein NKL07_00790 [Mesorhizobium sp. C280B]|uniref:hypothetical protein n=1 Tax=unclassified Mesorhizobium TaxID=325217 RepID=UPI0003CF13EF|nr:hypothetical protein [Mesorhizobium sp. LSJC280B00]ESW75469.1 hypothetical protein X772_32605 [Mesorhizobium sp. LSJC280B00]